MRKILQEYLIDNFHKCPIDDLSSIGGFKKMKKGIFLNYNHTLYT